MIQENALTPQKSKCPLCNSEGVFSHEGKDLLHGTQGSHTYMKCMNCEAVYHHPMPDSKTIGSYYPNVYYQEINNRRKHSKLKKGVLKYKYNYKHLEIPLLYKLLAPVASLFRYKSSIPFKPDYKCLDIGCGNGRFIHSMNSLGWKFEGVEFSPVAVKICHKAGLSVFEGELKDAGFPDNSFDIISARHLIEHIPDPKSLFKEISRILKPGGDFIIRTPNSKAFGRNWFGVNWFSDDIPRHLILFNSKNLTMLASKYEMHPQKIKTFSSPKSILNSIDYLTGNTQKPSRKKKMYKLLGRIFATFSTLINRGDELFIIFQKN